MFEWLQSLHPLPWQLNLINIPYLHKYNWFSELKDIHVCLHLVSLVNWQLQNVTHSVLPDWTDKNTPNIYFHLRKEKKTPKQLLWKYFYRKEAQSVTIWYISQNMRLSFIFHILLTLSATLSDTAPEAWHFYIDFYLYLYQLLMVWEEEIQFWVAFWLMFTTCTQPENEMSSRCWMNMYLIF